MRTRITYQSSREDDWTFFKSPSIVYKYSERSSRLNNSIFPSSSKKESRIKITYENTPKKKKNTKETILKTTKKQRTKSLTSQNNKKKKQDYEIDYFGYIEESINLRDQYIRLSNEINELKEEIVPLRKTRIDLERMLMERDRRYVIYNQVYEPHKRQVTYDPINHANIEEFIEARRIEMLTKSERKNIASRTNNSSLKVLEENIEKERDELIFQREKAMKMEEKIESIQFQIAMLKNSSFPSDIKEQKNTIEELRERIVEQIEYRKELKFQYNALSKLYFPQTQDEIDQSPQIQKLLSTFDQIQDPSLVVGFFDWPVRQS